MDVGGEQAPIKNEVDHFLGSYLLPMGYEGLAAGPGFLILNLGKINYFLSRVPHWQIRIWC